MAIASFFDKTALSAATFLRGFDRSAFEQKLNEVNVGVVFDTTMTKDSEQFVATELLVNLLARLYPTLCLICSDSSSISEHLRVLALQINPAIEIKTTCDGLSVAVATVESPLLDGIRGRSPIIYMGSAGWIAKVGTTGPMDWEEGKNILGAAAAACLAAANVFRYIFSDQLGDPKLDENLSLNLFDYSINTNGEQPSLPPTDLSGTTLVGAGAIGNAVIWAFRRLPQLHGGLNVVDHEAIELSNLQRYVLTDNSSERISKVALAGMALAETKITVNPFPCKWADFFGSSDYSFSRLAVAVDTVQERVNISGSLAKATLNAWTQADEVGVSRHFQFGNQACLCCLYFPEREIPSEAQLVSHAIGLPGEEMLVRELLQTNKPVDRPFLEKVASALNISAEEIVAFEGKTLRQFYSEAICGGMVLRLGGKADTNTEVPMAFQSALAGIFLASEIVIAANQMRKHGLANTTRVQMLQEVSGNLLTPVAVVSRCICQDPDYRSVYQKKYGAAER